MWSNQASSAVGGAPAVPRGEVVASVERYEEARAVVDRLVRAEFSAGQVSIVGSGLRTVERVTGRMNVGRAALAGLLSGLMLGVFVGLFVLVLSPDAQLPTLVSVVFMAIGFSVLWNVIGYTLGRRKREFTSTMQVAASHFDVIVLPEAAASARETLRQAGIATASRPSHIEGPGPTGAVPGNEPAPHAAPPSDAPKPRTYGEAQDELRRGSRRE